MPVTNYIWDDENYVAETDGSNVVQVVYTNELREHGGLVSARISGTTSYYHFDDLQGSTRQLTNSAGSVTDTWIYDVWGNVVARSGTTSTALTWNGESGYYSDVELGSYYVRERTYSPNLGRWTSMDIYEVIYGLNRFLYVMNLPTLLIDPSGMRFPIGGGAAARPAPGVRPAPGGTVVRGNRGRPGNPGSGTGGAGTVAPGRAPGSTSVRPMDPVWQDEEWWGYQPPPPYLGQITSDCGFSADPRVCGTDPWPATAPLPGIPEPVLRPQPGFKRPPYPRNCWLEIGKVGDHARGTGCPIDGIYQCHHMIPKDLFKGNDQLPLWFRDQCWNLCCLPSKSHDITRGGNNWYNNCLIDYVEYICQGTIAYTGMNNPLCLHEVLNAVQPLLYCCPMQRCQSLSSPCKKCCRRDT